MFLSESGYSIYTQVSGWAKQNKGREATFPFSKENKWKQKSNYLFPEPAEQVG